jgi:hypothetical protein
LERIDELLEEAEHIGLGGWIVRTGGAGQAAQIGTARQAVRVPIARISNVLLADEGRWATV